MSKKATIFLVTLLTIFLLLWLPVRESFAGEEDETSGLRADSLTVNVGYYGGPYYQKQVFTVDELSSLGHIETLYSYIDSMPAVCLNYARGVPLSTIMEAAGIDINSIQRFYFYTNDNKGGYFTDFTKKALLDTVRYYYPNLVFRFYEPDFCYRDDAAAAEGAVPVPTMIALSDSWKRHLPGADDFGESANPVQRTQTRFRLLFGQIDTETPTANRSAKWIHSIYVMLGGGPTITTAVTNLEKEVGSSYRITATVSAADELIAEQIRRTLVWSSSDPGVAAVDGRGNVTIIDEGEVEITVSYRAPGGEEVKASVRVKGVAATSGEPPAVEKKPVEETGLSVQQGLLPGFAGKTGGGETACRPVHPALLRPVAKGIRIRTASSAKNFFALHLGSVSSTGNLHRLFADSADKAENGRETVQNWRETEMAASAVSLGWEEDPPATQAVLAAGAALLLLSFVARVAGFYLEI